MSLHKFQLFLSAALLTSAAALGQTTTTGTVTQSANTPVVGVASSETLQINVVNTASNASNGTLASCTGTVSFLNASGQTIGSASPFTVTSGAIASVSLPFSKIGVTGTRAEVRAVITRTVTLTPSAATNVPCLLQGTLETYDTSTGVTHVYVPNLSLPSATFAIPVAAGSGGR